MSREDADITAIARATVVAHEMLPAGAVVCAMVSGGADSACLLRLLASGDLGDDLALSVLHVNHLIRPEADDDEAFVRALCDELGVTLRVARYDVAAYAVEHGLNLEDAGRTVRYRFAEEEIDASCDAVGVSREFGRIAVAHTRDDRLETLVMRLVTGAGATGLSSLRPMRGRVIRPLIGVSRDAVRAYLRELGHVWCEDASNLDTTRLRARVRHDVLPLLRDINPCVDDALTRTSEILGDEDDLLREMGEAFVRDFATVRPGEVRFERAMLGTLSRAMRRRTLRVGIALAFPESSRLEFQHLEALVDGLAEDGFARDLPEGLRARVEYGNMIVSLGGEAVPALAPCLLSIPGTADLGIAGLIHAEEVSADIHETGSEAVVVDVGDATTLVVDHVREGDRMRPLGMDGTKKLSDLLVDAKIPRNSRRIVPIIRNGEGIVWVAGVRIDHTSRVTRETVRAVRLRWEHPEGS